MDNHVSSLPPFWSHHYNRLLATALENPPIQTRKECRGELSISSRGLFGLAAILRTALLLTGCGAVHQANVRSDVKAMNSNVQASQVECKQELAVPALDPIRDKVELLREPTDGAPPFSIMANDTFPTDAERAAISRWATIRDGCLKRANASMVVPSATGNDASYLQRRFSAIRDVQANVGYSHFTRKNSRMASSRENDMRLTAMAGLDAMRQAYLDQEQQRQMLARQQLANTFAAWSEYMQAVNARQPQTVYLNGTIQVVRQPCSGAQPRRWPRDNPLPVCAIAYVERTERLQVRRSRRTSDSTSRGSSSWRSLGCWRCCAISAARRYPYGDDRRWME